MTVTAPRRRADGNEDGIRRAHRRRRIGLEKQTRLLRILRDQIVEAGFENRDHAVSQRANLAGVLVDACDHMAEIGEACAGHESDIARPDHRNAHDWMSPIDAGLQVYFCDPQSPWQRATNENTNGLLRQYFPKGTDLSGHSADEIAAVATALNTRPRKTIKWKTPAEALDELLRSANKLVATTA